MVLGAGMQGGMAVAGFGDHLHAGLAGQQGTQSLARPNSGITGWPCAIIPAAPQPRVRA